MGRQFDFLPALFGFSRSQLAGVHARTGCVLRPFGPAGHTLAPLQRRRPTKRPAQKRRPRAGFDCWLKRRGLAQYPRAEPTSP